MAILNHIIAYKLFVFDGNTQNQINVQTNDYWSWIKSDKKGLQWNVERTNNYDYNQTFTNESNFGCI